ncbi:MAG: DUF6775 family putative metallopeptidase [Nitrosopumilaceae archaeon]
MKISKIFLYDEPSVPEINISQLADFIKKNFSIDVEIRKNIFSNVKKTTAKQLSTCRIFNIRKPFEFHFPRAEEIKFEKDSFQNSSGIKNIIMYDGFEFQKVLSDLISEAENSAENFHLIFTTRLICTYDYNDYRYHGRAIICSNPSIISTTGIIEAPAKSKEFYIELMSYMTQGLNLESIKKKYQGSYLEYHDERISTIVEGYAMQALFYYLTGEPFCELKECRLFNPHWQKELLHSQIEIGKLCKKHQKILEDLVLDLNS